MGRAEEFLRRAEGAERQAADCVGVTRDQFLEVARQWRLLARQAGGRGSRAASARRD